MVRWSCSVFGIGLAAHAFRPVQSTAQQPGAGHIASRYSVVETEGTNLIITDNSSDMLYYYTVEAPADDDRTPHTTVFIQTEGVENRESV